jgi:acyl dehydratase
VKYNVISRNLNDLDVQALIETRGPGFTATAMMTFSTVVANVFAVLLGSILAGIFFLWHKPIRDADGNTIISLDKSPNQVNRLDVAHLVSAIALKHALPAFTGYSPPLRSQPGTAQEFLLPCLKLEGPLSLTENNLRAFNRAVVRDGQRYADVGLNPFFLIAQTVPLAINILAHRDCPIKPFGAVNTRNKFLFINPSALRDWKTLASASKLGHISYSAHFGGPTHPGQRQKRGVEFCITVDVMHGKDKILQQELWFLQFLPKSFKPLFQDTPKEQPQVAAVEGRQSTSKSQDRVLRLSGRDPIRWAATSKDYNPIHVSPLGAKLFGFRSVVAHGNHVVALALQQLIDGKTDVEKAAGSFIWETDNPCEIEVKFLRPTTLPATLTVTWDNQKGDRKTFDLVISSRDKLNVSAVVRPVFAN